MNPTIELKLFATLAARTPDNASQYPIAEGMTVAQLVDSLKIQSVTAKLVFVNGIRVNPETQLKGGERVGIFPPVGGG